LSTMEFSHKTDVGGILLDLNDRQSVEVGIESLYSRASELGLAAGSYSILVQKMVPSGIELILGGKYDPTFGPVVMFGLGGIQVEIYNDVAFRVAPISRLDASQMITEVRGSKLLDGFRGFEPIDREPVIQALLSISRMMMENDDLVELDINPLIASNEGVMAVDVRALRNS
jgi:acyl-CoA synthetase (NDP forming)